MKTCKTCGTEKSLEGFYVNKSSKDGRGSSCKECTKERSKVNGAKRREKNSSKTREPRQQGFRLLPEGMRQCGKCSDIKEIDKFYKDSSRSSGVSSYCKECINRRNKERREDSDFNHLSTRRKWREDNKEHLQEYNRKWSEANRERRALNEARRRARKKSLPDTVTVEELEEIINKFNGKCSICGKEYEHMDHFIPLSTNHGGTTKENLVPMCSSCNTSKRDYNPFVWAESLPEYERGRFDVLVKYLTELNGIVDVESYKAHVYQCFK